MLSDACFELVDELSRVAAPEAAAAAAVDRFEVELAHYGVPLFNYPPAVIQMLEDAVKAFRAGSLNRAALAGLAATVQQHFDCSNRLMSASLQDALRRWQQEFLRDVSPPS